MSCTKLEKNITYILGDVAKCEKSGYQCGHYASDVSLAFHYCLFDLLLFRGYW